MIEAGEGHQRLEGAPLYPAKGEFRPPYPTGAIVIFTGNRMDLCVDKCAFQRCAGQDEFQRCTIAFIIALRGRTQPVTLH